MPVPRGGSAPVLLSAAKNVFYQCGFAQLPRHRALQAQTSHLQLNMLAKLNQKILLENYLLHRGNHLLGLNDSRPKKSHQPNTAQYNSCLLSARSHTLHPFHQCPSDHSCCNHPSTVLLVVWLLGSCAVPSLIKLSPAPRCHLGRPEGSSSEDGRTCSEVVWAPSGAEHLWSLPLLPLPGG